MSSASGAELFVELLAGAHAGELDLDVLIRPQPESRIRLRARSTILTGSPMSRTQIWPPSPMAAACSTSWQASGMVMKKRRISGWVTVTGPPAAICFLKMGMTLPLEPSTLPKRTATNLVPPFCKAEEQQFGHALGGAHDVGGPDGFVGGDHDEVLDAVLGGGDGHVVGAEDVVLDGLEDVGLHHGDVLVGGGVIDDGGRVLAKDFVQAGAILDAADLGVEGDVGEGLAHFAVDFEQGGFGDFEADDAGGVEAGDLAAEFGADGAGGAGDQDDFAFERAADLVLFEADGVAAEEVFDGDVADLGGEAVAFDDFGEAGNGFVGNAGLVATLEDRGHLRAGGGRQGDENRLDGLSRDDGGQRSAGAEDLARDG